MKGASLSPIDSRRDTSFPDDQESSVCPGSGRRLPGSRAKRDQSESGNHAQQNPPRGSAAKTGSGNVHPPVRARLGDRNRKYLLLALAYPAVLGTIIWESLGLPFESALAWLLAMLVVAHFALDFLYLKINLDYYGSEEEFRYGWRLFSIDIGIVVLMRMALTSAHGFPEPPGLVLQPYGLFAAIYGLYVLWEIAYEIENRGQKRSSEATVWEYVACLVVFAICTTLHVLYVLNHAPIWVHHVCNALFLLTMLYTTYKHYVSVFVDVGQDGSGKAST